MSDQRVADFIDFAIREEVKAAQLYERYAGIVESRAARELLGSMAVMERGHEMKLREFARSGRMLLQKSAAGADLHLADFMTGGTIAPDSDPQEVFVFAMKAEEKAAALYSRLAELESDSQTVELFLSLASEETGHKRGLEEEYERAYMREN
jgi:rubrerythrin